MKLAEAGKGHLVVGSNLVLFSFGAALLLVFTQTKMIGWLAWMGFVSYFFGTWGGVEIGRVVESSLRNHQ